MSVQEEFVCSNNTLIFSCELKMLESFAYIIELSNLVASSCKSLTKIRESKCSNIDPCASPHVIISNDVTVSAYYINCFRKVR